MHYVADLCLPQCLTTIAVPALLEHSSISICSHSMCLTYIGSLWASCAGHCYARPQTAILCCNGTVPLAYTVEFSVRASVGTFGTLHLLLHNALY